MKLYSKSELKDSRIFFDKKPPKFGTYFTIFTSFLLVGSLFVSNHIQKVYVVKAQGIVRGSDSHYISSNVNGIVVEVIKEEGSLVEENEVLLVVSDGKESLQQKVLEEQIDSAYEKIQVMNKYQKSLDDFVNYMSNSGLEQEYFAYMEYFLKQNESDNFSNDIKLKKIKYQINKLNEIFRDIKELEENIQGFKYFDRKNKIEEIKKNIKETDKNINQLEKRMNLELDDDQKKNIQKELNDHKELKNELQNKFIQLEAESLKLSNLEIKLDNKYIEKANIEEELESLKVQTDNFSDQTSQVKSQLLIELGKQRSEVETQIVELELNLKLFLEQKETYEIKATQNGIVHYLNPLRVGSSIQQNQVIADISSQKIDSFIIEAYVQASDISKISINDDVNIAINGVNSTRFGTLKGKLTFIDSGTISQETQDGTLLFYRVIINTEYYFLESKDETIELLSSMPVEARIIYEKETYFYWILNLLNFKN